MSPHEKVLLESVYNKEQKQSPTEVYLEFNIIRLNGRGQVSHKTLSEMVAEVELYSYVEVERKGRGGALISTSLQLGQSNGRRYWTRSKT